nr:CapA family protein [Tissierella sp.]
MSRENRKKQRRRKKVIMRRRILLLIFLLVLIPLIYKGTSLLVRGSKSLYSSISDRREDKESEKKPGKETIPIKDKDKEQAEDKEKEKPAEAEKANAKILSVGDVMFHMPQVKSAYIGDGNYDFADSFKYVKNHIEAADVSIANFESVTAGNDKRFSGFPQFNSPKETLLGLKESGFDIVSTANNHSLDQGKEGILKTLEYAKSYGLKTIGTYKEKQTEYLIEEKNGIKLGFLAYTYGVNGLEFYLSPEELSTMVNIIDETKIKRDIEALKKQADIVVVSVHWGTEYQRETGQQQIDLGHKMVDWGANVILGSHPHVLQKSEIIKKDGMDNFIIYSMGNFFSNQRQETMGNSFTEDGVMVEIDIEKDIANDKTWVKSVNFLPTWIDKYNEDGRDIYRILSTRDVLEGKLDIQLSDKIKARIEKSQRDSLEILNYQ